MSTSAPWIATLAVLRREDTQRVATFRAVYADGRLTIEPYTGDPVPAESARVIDSIRAGEIKLLPNGMLRFIEAGGAKSRDLAEFINSESQGRLCLFKNLPGIEEGLAMKQRVWSQDPHLIPFNELVKRMKASLPSRQH